MESFFGWVCESWLAVVIPMNTITLGVVEKVVTLQFFRVGG